MREEYKFLIPVVRDSNRKGHSKADWDWLDNQLVNMFGGFTRGTNVFGCWRDEGHNIVFDESTPFYVPSECASAVFYLIERCCERFDQCTIYVREPLGRVVLYDRE